MFTDSEVSDIAQIIQTVSGILHNGEDRKHQLYLAHSAIAKLERFIERNKQQ